MNHPSQFPAAKPHNSQSELCFEFSVAYRHRVIFSEDVLNPANPALAEVLEPDAPGGAVRAAVFVDGGLAHHSTVVTRLRAYFAAHAGRLVEAVDPVILSGGEAAKRDSTTFERCVATLRKAHLDRHCYAIALGGGAVLDAVGFAASVVHRGLRQIRIPTTVLAQADAGIGVKNGINYRGSKNFLGCFAPPAAVLNDFTLLSTLPRQAWRDGTVEAVKVGLIRDAAFFQWIEQNTAALVRCDPPTMQQLIFRCAQLHLDHIATGGDPFERGSARPLDFGHWAAHKLEQLSDGALSHGAAVAIGIAIDTTYASRIGLVAATAATRVIHCLSNLGFSQALGHSLPFGRSGLCQALLAGIEEFREHLGGLLSVTMLRGIGEPIEVHEVDRQVLRDCIEQILFGGVIQR